MQSNSVCLTGMSIVNGQTLCSYIKYGSSLSISNKEVGIGETLWYKYLNLEKISWWFFIITARKDECFNLLPSIYVHDSEEKNKNEP